ncbi:membrane-bound lytic murein transglycosylase F [Shewanella gelidii]|uniref:Membrane-bound lytic murein transglycosylase F n=1 Tax=Shewanella gelidii TaxID=1642821 RepID=A0A917JJV1_9GAMM|nr:membrane-bound lytic murein transglycosylase F [Shewanella gelidii]
MACQEQTVSDEKLSSAEPKTHLKVGTLYGPQIYITTGQGKYGFDYELAKRFARHLGLKLSMTPYASVSDLYAALENQDIDIIAAGLTETPNRKARFRLGPPLYFVDQILVYRQGSSRPRMITDIDEPITINADSAYVETLSRYQQQHPELTWKQVYGKDNEELLHLIAKGELQYTVSDSSSLLINRRMMPELRQGPILANDLPVVWLLPANQSDTLMSHLLEFWHKVNVKGTLEHLNERYFGHVKRFDYVDTRAFIRAIDSKLPKYKHLFQTYAGELDWRKLAATSYQESHWNPKARSPTGVRGMMMLTLPTAKQVGIKNRLDAEQSIEGGARYLKKLLRRLPDSIPENQRIWFALASYNIGMGHVEDARKLAENMGLNPSAWRDVKQVLPLLQQRQYYQKTRYGYARGSEAAHYVDNIRRYYDTMVWLDSQSAHFDEKSEMSQTTAILSPPKNSKESEVSASQPK